jgi:taurine dioxygenase
LKRTLQGLRAIHAKKNAFDAYTSADRQVSAAEKAQIAKQYATTEAIHPVVTRHPETGRPVLYVNPTYTVRFEGWTAQESAPLLQVLYQAATRPEFTCRFQWREGSVAFWDNRSVMHFALNDYHGARRLMHRITIEGMA